MCRQDFSGRFWGGSGVQLQKCNSSYHRKHPNLQNSNLQTLHTAIMGAEIVETTFVFPTLHRIHVVFVFPLSYIFGQIFDNQRSDPQKTKPINDQSRFHYLCMGVGEDPCFKTCVPQSKKLFKILNFQSSNFYETHCIRDRDSEQVILCEMSCNRCVCVCACVCVCVCVCML